jgi:23S rRNA (cytosine1962-C5)-methyltransferase
MASTPRARIPADTAAAVARGHPWVFRDRPFRDAPGTVVELIDDDGRRIGWGLADEGSIAIRVLGRGPAPGDFAAEIAARVAAASEFRSRTAPPDTDCWRVVNGEGDGMSGLVVDRYGSLAVVRLYARAWEPWIGEIVSAIRACGWASTVFRRLGVQRVDGESGGTTLDGPEPCDAIVVREHGMRLVVRPNRGQKTGLFLDQREHRAWVRRVARERHTVNLFSYSGAFSVAAALGGSRRTTSVDVAADAIDDARENFRLNGLDPGQHAFEVADAFEWTPERPADLVIVDPPSLAHDRASEASARRAYRRLHAHVARHVGPDGLLATSSCTARLAAEAWRQVVASALAPVGEWSWHLFSAEPPDHPVALSHAEGRYLKFALLRRR